MKITRVTVRLGKTVPNPLREFSNLRADVELTATVDKGKRSDDVYPVLRAKVEALLDRTLAAMRSEEEAIHLKEYGRQRPLCTCGHSIWAVHGRMEERGVASDGHGPCLYPGCDCKEAKEPAAAESCEICGCSNTAPCDAHRSLMPPGAVIQWEDPDHSVCVECAKTPGGQQALAEPYGPGRPLTNRRSKELTHAE